MRILHTSDWHLGKQLFGFSLLEDQRHFLTQIAGLARSERVDAVIIAGDVFDRPVPPSAAVELYDEFLTAVCVESGIRMIAVAGNHDSAARLEFGHALYSKAGYHIAGRPSARIHKIRLEDSLGEAFVYLLPYMHPAEARALLHDASIKSFDQSCRALLAANKAEIDETARNIAVAHGFFAQGEHGGLLTSDSEINVGGIDIAGLSCFEGFDYIALGHLHLPQWPEANRARYSGSPLKYSLSEESAEKSVTLVELRGKAEVSCETRVLLPLRDVRGVRGGFSQLCDLAWHTSKQFDDYVFAEIEGVPEPYALEKLRHVFPNLLGLRFLSEAARENPLFQNGLRADKPGVAELFTRFYRDIRGEDLTPGAYAVISEAVDAMEAGDDQ